MYGNPTTMELHAWENGHHVWHAEVWTNGGEPAEDAARWALRAIRADLGPGEGPATLEHVATEPSEDRVTYRFVGRGVSDAAA